MPPISDLAKSASQEPKPKCGMSVRDEAPVLICVRSRTHCSQQYHALLSALVSMAHTILSGFLSTSLYRPPPTKFPIPFLTISMSQLFLIDFLSTFADNSSISKSPCILVWPLQIYMVHTLCTKCSAAQDGSMARHLPTNVYPRGRDISYSDARQGVDCAGTRQRA